jgi:hypothetical protein
MYASPYGGFLFQMSLDQVSKLKAGLSQTQVGKKADEKDLQDLVRYMLMVPERPIRISN